MKQLLVSILILVSGITFSQSDSTKVKAFKAPKPSHDFEDCKCSYPLKSNDQWCIGPKGGVYCINRNGNKTYKSSIK